MAILRIMIIGLFILSYSLANAQTNKQETVISSLRFMKERALFPFSLDIAKGVVIDPVYEKQLESRPTAGGGTEYSRTWYPYFISEKQRVIFK